MANVSVEAPRSPSSRWPWAKVAIVTLIIAVPAWILGPIIWPPLGMGPSPAQMPFFMFEAFVEALALGLGVSFLVFGLHLVRRVEPALRLRAWLIYLSIGWALVSWWPHGGLHMSNGDDMQRLLYIEYGFHITLIAAAAVAGYCFLSLVREWSARQRIS
jgi:hypothetical protein